MRTPKHTWQEYKTNQDILSELKINSVVQKILNYRNAWVQHVWQKDRDRLTATLNCEISTMWKMKPRLLDY